MKKKILGLLLGFALILCGSSAFARGDYRIIDDFERNPDLKKPEWWKFDNVTVMVMKNLPYRPGDKVAKATGKNSLNIKGNAENWYCGGMGTYLGIDATIYTGLEISVYGYAENNGTIKIEFYDDDKGSWETQYDKNWIPLKDDIWAYEQKVDWKGWKQIYIPFSKFVLTNSKRGDGVLNFDQNKGSGGLLQTQIVIIAPAKDGEVNVNIDNIKLVSSPEGSDAEEDEEYR